MSYAVHLPQAPSKVAVLGVAAALAGAGGALALSDATESTHESAGAPVQAAPTDFGMPKLGPSSHCWAKWGC
jgi:hypothetical protein